MGIVHDWKPNESLKKYGQNVWLYGAISLISQEVARTKFHLETEFEDGEVEITRKHQALSTLRNPINMRGKSHLTGMTLMMLLKLKNSSNVKPLILLKFLPIPLPRLQPLL